MTQTIVTAMNAQPNPMSDKCNFCGTIGHYIGRCPVMEGYKTDGRFQRNAELKISLPRGGFVPRVIVGNTLAEKIDKWPSALHSPMYTAWTLLRLLGLHISPHRLL